jgi:hypothetical protein
MVNQYFVIHISVLLLLDIFFEGNIEETGKQPKRGQTTQVKLKKFYQNQTTIDRQKQKP